MTDVSVLHEQLAHWEFFGELPMRSGLEHVVRENPFSVTMRRASTKIEGPVTAKAESTLEYNFYCVLDFDRRVEKYKEQPVVIPWRTVGGQYRRYTPDVLVKFRAMDGLKSLEHVRSTLFEIKPYQVLKANWPELRHKVRAIQRSLEGTFVPFKFVTERQLRPAFVKNIKFLLDFDIRHMTVGQRLSPKQHERMQAVVSRIPNDRSTTPKEILDRISTDVMEQAFHVPWVWHCLRTGALQADLIDPLTLDTEVWSRTMNHSLAKWMTREYDWYR